MPDRYGQVTRGGFTDYCEASVSLWVGSYCRCNCFNMYVNAKPTIVYDVTECPLY